MNTHTDWTILHLSQQSQDGEKGIYTDPDTDNTVQRLESIPIPSNSRQFPADQALSRIPHSTTRLAVLAPQGRVLHAE